MTEYSTGFNCAQASGWDEAQTGELANERFNLADRPVICNLVQVGALAALATQPQAASSRSMCELPA